MSRYKTVCLTGIGAFIGLGFLAAIFTFALYFTGNGSNSGTVSNDVSDDLCTDPVDSNNIINGSDVEIGDGLRVYFAIPATRCPKGAVILLHDRFGYDSFYSRFLSLSLAEHGYTVAMPDLFDGESYDLESDPERLRDQGHVDEDIAVTFRYLRQRRHFQDIAVVGIDWGGKQVVRLCARSRRDDVRAGISLYPVNVTPQMALSVLVPTLFIYDNNRTEADRVVELFQAANRLMSSIDADDTELNGSPAAVEFFYNTRQSIVNAVNTTDITKTSKGVFSAIHFWFDRFFMSTTT